MLRRLWTGWQQALRLRKTPEAYEPGGINERALRQLLDSVDDTIEQLVEAFGDETAKRLSRS
jgi:hypothetical protein